MRLLKALHAGEFSGAEQSIARYILAHLEDIAHLTTRELAERTYTSPAAVSRLCQKLGTAGYSDFRLRLTSEISRTQAPYTPRRPITDADTPASIAAKMASLQIEAIEETKNELDPAQVERIARAMQRARSIDIYAYDQNYTLAEAAVFNLLQVQCPAVCYSSLTSQLAAALMADKSHVAILISRTGANQRLLRTAKILHSRQVPTVLISTDRDTELARLAGDFLYVANTVEYLDFGASIFSVGVRYYLDVLFGLILASRFAASEKFGAEVASYLGRDDDNDRIW